MRTALIACALTLAAPQLIVRTTYGEVEGEEQDGVRIWRSIPFAAPPVGAKRFSPPAPPNPWAGVKDVRPYATPCPQLKLAGDIFYGGEDCLQLSVYARASPAPKPGLLPILFWIYGGAYVLGDDEELGWYDGAALAKRHDMIVIAANYRIGVYGFLALDTLFAEDGTTGNAGVLDQVAALEWVKANAAAFGGDPTRVTIAGESAGGMSVAWHLTSPRSAGLFAGAIVESATFDTPQFFQSKADAIAFNALYSEAVGCNQTDGGAQLACLRALPTQKLMLSLADWLNPNWPCIDPANCDGARGSVRGVAPPRGLPALAPIMPWGPAIDGVATPVLPYDALLSGDFNKVPVLMGTNRNEGSIFIPMMPILDEGLHFPPLDGEIPKFVEHAYNMFPPAVVRNLTTTFVNPMYPESAYVNNTWEQASDELTHAFFACATRRAARLLAPHVPTFLYQFSYKLDFPENKDIPELGNYHTSELDFVFAQVWPPLVHTFSPLDLDMVAVFGAYWGNFVATGDPNKGDLAAPRPWRNFVAGADEWNIQLELPLSETARLDEAVCDNAWDPFFAGLRAAGSVRSDVAARYPRLAARAAGRL